MLTRLIVDLYAWIIEIAIWLALLVSGVVGYIYIVPMLNAAGWVLENEAAWSIFGAVAFPLVAFVAFAAAWGPFLVLVDIRKSVRALEAENLGYESRVLPREKKEPFL